jgi:hypothetical protein
MDNTNFSGRLVVPMGLPGKREGQDAFQHVYDGVGRLLLQEVLG